MHAAFKMAKTQRLHPYANTQHRGSLHRAQTLTPYKRIQLEPHFQNTVASIEIITLLAPTVLIRHLSSVENHPPDPSMMFLTNNTQVPKVTSKQS